MNTASSFKRLVSRIEKLLSLSSIAKSSHRAPRSFPASRGFTLIETFVAVTILMTAVAGPLTLSSRGLQSAILARNQLTASFLAQEGIEFVRQKRDTNKLQGLSWFNGLSACTTGLCTIDAREDTVASCPSGVCPPLKYNDTYGFYGYSITDPTSPFTRSVKITLDPNGYEATASSTVVWRTGLFTRELTLIEVLTDWQ